VDHKTLNITPLPTLQPSVVIVYFRIIGEVDGTTYVQYARQKYGPNGLNSESDPDGGLFALIQTIDLVGASYVNGWLETTPMNAADADADPTLATVRAWWASVKPELASPRLRDLEFTETLVIDEDDAEVNLANFPNVLLDGNTIQPWMRVYGDPVEGVRVRVTAKITYKEYDADTDGLVVKEVNEQSLSWVGTLTNATTGHYSSRTSSGEGIPTDLAIKLWQSLATLQYQGQNVLVERENSAAIGMANTLRLTNGHADWATMDAQIQGITEDDANGETAITFGPARHLNTGDLAAIWRFNRGRIPPANLGARETGQE